MLISDTWNQLTVCKQMNSNDFFKKTIIAKFGIYETTRIDMP